MFNKGCIRGYLLTNHKEFMKYIFDKYDVNYVKNTTTGSPNYNQFQVGSISFDDSDRCIDFFENYWVNGEKIQDGDTLTYISMGDFGFARDVFKGLINHFGGCCKTDDKEVLFKHNIDNFTAKTLLKKD